MRYLQLVLGAAVLALGVGCAESSADPPGTPASFPDLSGYAPVDVQAYSASSPGVSGFEFTTPDGQVCSHNTMNSLDDPSRLTLTCEGPRPDQGAGTWQVRVATDEPAVLEPSYPPLDPAYVAASGIRQLPAMHKIVYQDIECGVDSAGMTACQVGEHGFVLTPTATTLF